MVTNKSSQIPESPKGLSEINAKKNQKTKNTMVYHGQTIENQK